MRKPSKYVKRAEDKVDKNIFSSAQVYATLAVADEIRMLREALQPSHLHPGGSTPVPGEPLGD